MNDSYPVGFGDSKDRWADNTPLSESEWMAYSTGNSLERGTGVGCGNELSATYNFLPQNGSMLIPDTATASFSLVGLFIVMTMRWKLWSSPRHLY
jgi:hypothetical protein